MNSSIKLTKKQSEFILLIEECMREDPCADGYVTIEQDDLRTAIEIERKGLIHLRDDWEAKLITTPLEALRSDNLSQQESRLPYETLRKGVKAALEKGDISKLEFNEAIIAIDLLEERIPFRESIVRTHKQIGKS